MNSECGVSDFKESSYGGLIRGADASNVARGQFPWMAAYFYQEKYLSRFICGGSLISSKLVVTAAHCIQSHDQHDNEKRRPEYSTFFLGKNNLESSYGEKYAVSSHASHLHLHPGWKKGTKPFENDIAIVVLIQLIHFSMFVKPLCIWRETESFADIINNSGVVAGWGKTDKHEVSTLTAKYVSIPVVSNEECLFSNPKFYQLLSGNAFCAGQRNAGKGPCNGDSGR